MITWMKIKIKYIYYITLSARDHYSDAYFLKELSDIQKSVHNFDNLLGSFSSAFWRYI